MCPDGKNCEQCAKGGSKYYFDEDEFDSLIKYGENIRNNVKKHKRSEAEIQASNEPRPLNKKGISGYDAYASNVCGITINSFSELEAYVKKSVFTRAEADKLLARLNERNIHDEGKKIDPYVLSTTKACPTCSFRSSHFHGHRCHVSINLLNAHF